MAAAVIAYAVVSWPFRFADGAGARHGLAYRPLHPAVAQGLSMADFLSWKRQRATRNGYQINQFRPLLRKTLGFPNCCQGLQLMGSSSSHVRLAC